MYEYLVYDKETKTHQLIEANTRGEAQIKALKLKGSFGLFRIFKPKTFKELRRWEGIIQSEQSRHEEK